MPSHEESSNGTPARRVFEGALIWSVVGLSIALLLIVLAGTVDAAGLTGRGVPVDVDLPLRRTHSGGSGDTKSTL